MKHLKYFKLFEDNTFADGILDNIGDPDKEKLRSDLMGIPASELASKIGRCANHIKSINRIVKYAIHFEATNDFGAINNAEEWLKANGFTNGSMCSDYPMAIIKGDGSTQITTKYKEQRAICITKWDRLDSNNYASIDGVIIPDEDNDLREGGAYILLFVFPD